MRFFLLQATPKALEGPWQAPKELIKHLKALRFKPGQEFLLLLPQGGAIASELKKDDVIELKGLKEAPRLRLMPITLATALPKGKRAEELIRRATEAGVENIIPIQYNRTISTQTPLPLNKVRRLEKIARETCQQCLRPIPPKIHRQTLSPTEAYEAFPTAHPIALVPGAGPLVMELGLHHPKEIILFVGPEGGFSSEELMWFRKKNIATAGLLPTVLRIEAAGSIATSICQHWFLQLDKGNSQKSSP